MECYIKIIIEIIVELHIQLVNIANIHILCGGACGACGACGAGGAGGSGYNANATNLTNLNFTLILGAGGIEGIYFSSRQGTSGSDSSISWTINSTNNSLIGYGGYDRSQRG